MKWILLVDDEDNLRRLLKAVLRKAGFEVFEARSSSAALKILESNHVDAIVTDVLLDDMDGPSLAHAAVAKNPSMPVVFMSGDLFDIDAEQRRHPYCAFLMKPFVPTTLVKTIQELDERRSRRG
jgi:two-component system cell cycle sensor histidine kinase/response regulator CckA